MKVEFQRFDSFDIAKRCNPLDIAESCSLHLIEYVLILVFFLLLVYAGMSVGESIG
jgi:hypothetical protein